jgi:hypothetical protein
MDRSHHSTWLPWAIKADFIAVSNLNYFSKSTWMSTLKEASAAIWAFLHIFLDQAGERS